MSQMTIKTITKPFIFVCVGGYILEFSFVQVIMIDRAAVDIALDHIWLE